MMRAFLLIAAIVASSRGFRLGHNAVQAPRVATCASRTLSLMQVDEPEAQPPSDEAAPPPAAPATDVPVPPLPFGLPGPVIAFGGAALFGVLNLVITSLTSS